MFPELCVQVAPTRLITGVNTGAAPVPYASKLIGLPLVPLDDGMSCSFHTPPRCNNTLSPGFNVIEPFT